jgi:hypothetical protein
MSEWKREKKPGENRREHQKGGKKEEKKGRKRATVNNPSIDSKKRYNESTRRYSLFC